MFTEKQLAEILEVCEKAPVGPWKYEREEQSAGAFGLNLVFETVVDANGVKILRSNDKWLAQFIAISRTALPQLAEEIIKLREKYEQPNPKCGKGHENTLPLALWDCPMCTEELTEENAKLRATIAAMQDALEEVKARCELRRQDDDAHYENYYEAKQALADAGYGGEE